MVLLTSDEALRIYEAFDCRCFRCHRVSDLTLDHHVPLVLGGKLEVGNVVILCRKCNGLKADLTPEQFYSVEDLASLAYILAKATNGSLQR